MKVRDMKEMLDGLGDDEELMCLDGFNGGGYPREINLGPAEHVVTAEEAEECADCEGLVGQTVRLIGFGCY